MKLTCKMTRVSCFSSTAIHVSQCPVEIINQCFLFAAADVICAETGLGSIAPSPSVGVWFEPGSNEDANI